MNSRPSWRSTTAEIYDIRRPISLREQDDRWACRRNQEYSICFSSVMYVCKKLLLDKWFIIVDSMKLSSHRHL